ncbi:oxidoreductase, 2OG-Fe(II) oxygenase family protein [Cryptosporidium felis]|nr:oxidoreductase, 2OG-Fe(II) oxygenase family protein [Cryptosporidium felis]
MSENSLTMNEATKTVIKGVAPPEPKLLGTYINMVPISGSETLETPGAKMSHIQTTPEAPVSSEGSNSTVTTEMNSSSIPTSQFPVSAMNMEQLQQFMMRMQLSQSKDLTGLGSGVSLPTFGSSAALNPPTTSNPISGGYNIPPVGALDPNILASLGMNVQKPTLQPIQFPNMQAGVPNLCGIQGQDLNLANWIQRQKIALALSELQNQSQNQTSDKTTGGGSTSTNVGASLPQTSLSSSGLPQVGGGSSVPGLLPPQGSQSQLTPQLAAFLGNPNLVPSKDAGNPQIANGMPAGGVFGANLNIPGIGMPFVGANTNVGSGAVPGTGNSVPGSLFPGMMQPTADISKIEAMVKQHQQQFVSNQLNAAAQLLRQHGIQATIGTEPLNPSSEMDPSKPKKQPALLQRIVASKVNPRIFIVPNALGSSECDKVIELIEGRLETSKISITKKDNKTGENESTEVKKAPDEEKEQEEFCRSATACIMPEETNLIKEIETRLGLLVDSSTLHMEPMLVHKYSSGDYIKEHHDGDTRTHTIAVFLSDIESGGELDFPYAGIKIKPKKGLAVVWPNTDSQGKTDYTTVHAVNRINDPKQEGEEKDEGETPAQESEASSSPASYLLYLHVNKEPVRLGFEASQAIRQVVQREDPESLSSPEVITQVSYPVPAEGK